MAAEELGFLEVSAHLRWSWGCLLSKFPSEGHKPIAVIFLFLKLFPCFQLDICHGPIWHHRGKMRWAILENKMFTLVGVSFLKCLLRKISEVFTYTTGENLYCVEGTIYPSISLLDIWRDIMPTPQGWEVNYAYYRCKNPSTIEE